MWKVLLLFTMMNDQGHSAAFQRELLVKELHDCNTIAEGVLASPEVTAAKKRNHIISERYFCTDEEELLGFWPIPERPPIPRSYRLVNTI